MWDKNLRSSKGKLSLLHLIVLHYRLKSVSETGLESWTVINIRLQLVFFETPFQPVTERPLGHSRARACSKADLVPPSDRQWLRHLKICSFFDEHSSLFCAPLITGGSTVCAHSALGWRKRSTIFTFFMSSWTFGMTKSLCSQFVTMQNHVTGCFFYIHKKLPTSCAELLKS